MIGRRVASIAGVIAGLISAVLMSAVGLAVPFAVGAYLTHGHLWGVRHAHADERAVCAAAQQIVNDVNRADLSAATSDLDALRDAAGSTGNTELRSAGGLATSDLGAGALSNGLQRVGDECHRIHYSLRLAGR